MLLFLSVVLLVGVSIFLFKYLWILRVEIPETPRKIVTGVRGSNGMPTIPRVIWTYWHDLPQPELVELCQKNWQRYAPDHELRVLHKHTLLDWIAADSMPRRFNELPAYRQADWVRLQLLTQHGGIWVDASIILTRDLDWVHQVQQDDNSEYVGFYIDKFTGDHARPVVENWFMAAIVASSFIRNLAAEFNRAIEVGEQAYIEEVKTSGMPDGGLRGVKLKMQEYLIMHVAASVVLARGSASRLSLYRAEDTAFGFHDLLKWRKRRVVVKLALAPCPKRLSFFIKLRGGERTEISKYLEKGWYYRGSLVAKFLKV